MTWAVLGASYLTGVLPGVIVFGVGLTITVAPLTATVLAAVSGDDVGAASGVNNAVPRVAGLLAVAVLPAAAGGTPPTRGSRLLQGLELPCGSARSCASSVG